MVKKDNQLKEYQYLIIAVSVGLIGALVLIFAGLVPSWKGMTNATEELKVAQAKRDNLEERLTNLKGLKDKEAELKEQNAKVLAALPEEKDISRLFVEFEGIAKSSGLTITQVNEASSGAQSSSDSAASLIVPVSYQISGATGNYNSLKTALSRFEQALRITTITGVDVSSTGGALNLGFTVNAFKRGATNEN